MNIFSTSELPSPFRHFDVRHEARAGSGALPEAAALPDPSRAAAKRFPGRCLGAAPG